MQYMFREVYAVGWASQDMLFFGGRVQMCCKGCSPFKTAVQCIVLQVRWILSTCRGHIVELQPKEQIAGMHGVLLTSLPCHRLPASCIGPTRHLSIAAGQHVYLMLVSALLCMLDQQFSACCVSNTSSSASVPISASVLPL